MVRRDCKWYAIDDGTVFLEISTTTHLYHWPRGTHPDEERKVLPVRDNANLEGWFAGEEEARPPTMWNQALVRKKRLPDRILAR